MSTERVLCVLCRAGGERLAVPARDVHKVVDRPQLTRMPRLPEAILGITHHRGRIVTVVDAVPLLGLERAPPPSAPGAGADATVPPSAARPAALVGEARVLVLDRGTRQLGLWVDGVDEVEALRIGADLPAGPSKALRIAQHRGQAVLAVDADKLVELILSTAA